MSLKLLVTPVVPSTCCVLYVGSSPGQRQSLSLLCLHPGGSQAVVFPGGPSACSARAEVAAVGEQVVNRL